MPIHNITINSAHNLITLPAAGDYQISVQAYFTSSTGQGGTVSCGINVPPPDLNSSANLYLSGMVRTGQSETDGSRPDLTISGTVIVSLPANAFLTFNCASPDPSIKIYNGFMSMLSIVRVG